MKKSLVLLLSLSFFSFNIEEHIVPDTGPKTRSSELNYITPPDGRETKPGYSPSSKGTFPEDPNSNNPFDDPNWPNVKPGDQYNNPPGDTYYNSPAGQNPMNRG